MPQRGFLTSLEHVHGSKCTWQQARQWASSWLHMEQPQSSFPCMQQEQCAFFVAVFTRHVERCHILCVAVRCGVATAPTLSLRSVRIHSHIEHPYPPPHLHTPPHHPPAAGTRFVGQSPALGVLKPPTACRSLCARSVARARALRSLPSFLCPCAPPPRVGRERPARDFPRRRE